MQAFQVLNNQELITLSLLDGLFEKVSPMEG